MAHYDKKLGVWLPVISDVITPVEVFKDILEEIPLTEEEKNAISKAEPIAEIKSLEPYHHELDEDEIDWWICNTCKKAYNSETVQKRHQTLKHK